MAGVMLEVCENCGRQIGKLETPMVWKERVVCGKCHKVLRGGGHAEENRNGDVASYCTLCALFPSHGGRWAGVARTTFKLAAARLR